MSTDFIVTYDQCLATIPKDFVCSYCGGKLTPIETVDNAGNPTHWTGCANCCKFDHGVPADIYEWVNEDVGHYYTQYERSKLAWKIYRFRLHEQNKTKEVPV